MPLQSSTAFEQSYRRLNAQQKRAVDAIEGPVMVIAGPGTGKTQILASRIARILLNTDTPPYSILALTFTESAASNMRERLISLIGPTAYSVHVQTFHSFCDEVIRACPEYFPLERESEVLTDLERFDLMEELLRNPELTALRTVNSPFHYLKAIIKAISDLKREGVSEHRFAELVADERARFESEQADLKKGELLKRTKNLAKMMELAQIYQQYQQKLRAALRYDYDDMIAFVAEAFEHNEELLLEYQEKLTYFLIDEYQDTNAAQNRVVELLASYWGEQANIFVVGDPHQSIYRFQGASLENTLHFTHSYPQAEVIVLDTGYRCPQVLYDAAAAVIKHNQVEMTAVGTGASRAAEVDAENELLQLLQRALQSTKPDGTKIQVFEAASQPLETIYVADAIKKLLDQGVAAHEIAILYKNNADAQEIEHALQKWGVPYSIDVGNDALQNPEILQFLTLLKVISDVRVSSEGYELFEVMNYPWVNLDRLHVMTVARAAGKTKMSLYDRVAAGYVEFCKLQFCDGMTALDFAVLEDFIDKLKRWGQQDAEMTFPAWFEMVMQESGFLNWVMEHADAVRLVHYLNAVYREVRALALQNHRLRLDAFLKSVDVMRAYGIQIGVEEIANADQSVTLSTVHKAKGREWEYVFIIQCIDGKWGNTRSPNTLPLPAGILLHTRSTEDDRDQDDRRLFYVAITRAKKQVTISYPLTQVSGNRTKPTLPSVFLAEVPERDKLKVTHPEVAAQPELYLSRLLQPSTIPMRSDSERAWFQQVVSEFKLSVTALNVYLRSPQEFIESILLKVPRATEGYQAFGTAMHYALEQYYKYVQKNQQSPSLKSFSAHFEEAIRKEILTDEEFELRLAYGKKVVKQYLEHYGHEQVRPLVIEKFFGYGWDTTIFEDIPLNGRIDRVDWIDEAKKTARVIDYKTGRARTTNEIEGKVGTDEFSERELALPDSIRGPYKRQLLFYKLLTDLDGSFPATITEGMFSFVEPDRDGKFIQRTFELKSTDVEDLKNLIREVMAEIRQLKFLDF